MPEPVPSLPFAIALREVTDDAAGRILAGLRAERLLGVLAADGFASSTGQGFGSLLADGQGRPLVVRDDGAVVAIDAATVAARLQRRLDGSVQLDPGEHAELIESTAPGFEPWTTIPEREAAAERAPVRWVVVLPEPADVAARWLTELATLVDGEVVLVPAGDRSLLVCDAWRFASWPRRLRPALALMQTPSELGLHAWLVRRIDADGTGRRRLLPSDAPDWSVVWGGRPTGILPPEGYPGLDREAIAARSDAQEALVERSEPEIPQAVEQELGLGARRAPLERLLAIDPPALTAALVVEALGLPPEVVPLVAGELDAAGLPGARSARRQSIGRTLVGTVGDEMRHGGAGAGAGGGLAVGIALAGFLLCGLGLAVLAGFGILTRAQTVDSPWFIAALAALALGWSAVGAAAAARIRGGRRRRTPLGDE